MARAVVRSLILLGWLSACTQAPATSDVGQPDAVKTLSTTTGSVDIPTIQCTSPESFTTLSLASGQVTTDVTFGWNTNAAGDIAAGTFGVAAFDGATQVAAAAEVAVFALPLAYGEHHVSLVMTQDGQPMVHPGSSCSIVIRVTRACIADIDCDDPYFCNSNTCESAGGGTKTCSFGPPPVANCCESDFQCAEGGVCDLTNNVCGACSENVDCDDGNACTTDFCESGTCISAAEDPECCDCNIVDMSPLSAQCVNGGFCGVAGCDCATNTCEYTPKDLPSGPCCETGDHASCDDADPCTEDTCVGNSCRHTDVEGGATECCINNAQCNDGNPCTTESCDVVNNSCVSENTAGDSCCATDLDCDDGDPLTWDACIVWQCVSTIDYEFCELDGVSDLVINEIMVNPAAVIDTQGEWIELYNRSDNSIDLSGAILTELGESPQLVIINTDEPLVVQPFDVIVLCRNGNPTENGGITCDHEYGEGFTLSNLEDEVIIKDSSGTILDEVHYDGGANFPTNAAGSSMALVSPDHDNNIGSSWRPSLAAIPTNSDKGTPGVANADVFQVLELTQCHESPDDVCTIDTCIDNSCGHVPVPGCCNVAADCMPPTACHAASCLDHECQYVPISAPECCLEDGDCDDESPCSLDKCVANNCQHGEAPDAMSTGCCEDDADCPGAGNPCLISECDVAANTCAPATVATGIGCCPTSTYPSPADPSECDDGDPSTIDSCKDFKCFSYPDASWCDGPGDAGSVNNCDLDGNPCTDTSCDANTQQCLFNPVSGCCAVDTDCFDGNPCTHDSCNQSSGSCEYPEVFNCCFQSTEFSDCDDGNVCTDDVCASLKTLDGSPGEFWGRCRGIRNSGSCCNGPADCDDNNACSVDSCDPVTNTCSHTDVETEDGTTCCDPAAARVSVQCADGNRCTTERCVDNRCEHDPVPPIEDSICCDTSATALLGDPEVQCDDNNACTQDVCAFGWCRHVATTGMDCCAIDDDCNDANSCTVDSCISVNGSKLCSNQTLNCDDGLFCNGAETCDAGVGCTTLAGSVPALDDDIDCTIDICDEGADTITHSANNAFCDNGQFCDGAETCSAVLGCQDGDAPSGDDGLACTIDGCVEANNSFSHVPNDSICDDGKLCNGEETCDIFAGCVAGVGAVDVDDGISCTIDSCDDATQQPKHLPDNSLCNDGLICTQDVCSTDVGCQNTLLANVCLVANVCFAAGATEPGNDCQVCDPAASTIAFSPKTAGDETCNGLDDDCDGATDEATDGQPITQACQNSCGELGTESCDSGVFVDCTAGPLSEICGDGIDNDCDGETDGSLCGDEKPGVVGAELVFSSTHGQVENLVVDNGDGTYFTRLRDLANPNVAGIAGVSAYFKAGPVEAFSVLAAPAVDIEVVAYRETLYADAAEARFVVQVRDLRARPVSADTVVTLVVSGLGLTAAEGTTTCLTDGKGRCELTWNAPATVFETGGDLQADVSVGGLSAAPKLLTVVADPGDLAMTGNEGGLQLPKSPLFTGDIIQVPVILSTAGSHIAAYDMDVTFNKFMLQVSAINPGSCSSFGSPVSNLSNGANTSGTIQFNAINSSATAPCATGNSIHVATISFKVLAGLTVDDPNVKASVTGTIVDMTDPNFVELAKNQPMLIADGEGIDFEGAVRAWSAAVTGILASSPDAQLLNWKSVTGLADTMQIDVTAYRRDYSDSQVATALSTGYGNTSPQVAQVTQSGFVTSGSLPGNTTAAVTHQGSVSKTQIHNLVAAPVELELTDDVLQPIANAVTAGGASIYQSASWRARAEFDDVDGLAWEQDVTAEFGGIGQLTVSSGLAYNSGTRIISGFGVGENQVTLRDAQGSTVATASLAVSAEPTTCTGLTVVAPCDIELMPVNPQEPPVQLGTAELTAAVYAYLSKHGQTCQSQVYANFDDGNRMRITGQNGVSYVTANPGVVTTTGTGLLTAQGGGITELSAKWTINGTELCAGAAPVKVSLPEAVSITVIPENSTIAVSSSDPAATIKGLPTTQQLTVTVNYIDGSTQDYTFDP
ncbi:MAG: hypothetical protein ACI9OJ_001162, partial [Myxococcota bacterium]